MLKTEIPSHLEGISVDKWGKTDIIHYENFIALSRVVEGPAL